MNILMILFIVINIFYIFFNISFLTNLFIFIFNIILITSWLNSVNLPFIAFFFFIIYIGGIIIYILILTFSLSNNQAFHTLPTFFIKKFSKVNFFLLFYNFLIKIKISYEILILQSFFLGIIIFFKNIIEIQNKNINVYIYDFFNLYEDQINIFKISHIIFIEHVELFIITGFYIFIVTIVLINNFIK